MSDTTRNRQVVLAHRDLAERLTRLPIGFGSPDQWTGFIPPEVWNGQHNDSPRRAALVELVAEAMAREQAAA
jgi:hypothetical protein